MGPAGTSGATAPPMGDGAVYAAPSPRRALSRREWLRAGFAATGLGAGAAASAAPPATYADVDPSAALARLVRRLTWGITPAELDLAQTLGHTAYLERHLNPALIPENPALTARLAAMPTLQMQPFQLYGVAASAVRTELCEAGILRAVLSARQLFERVVEFWTDHFNINITKNECSFLKTVDDRDVIRAHALSTFAALLTATAKSPAMLINLDNASSVAGNPNENYARELMELHTLGVAGFSQTDVHEIARCFTGWTLVAQSTTNPQSGTFVFNPAVHDTGPKLLFSGTPEQLAIPPRPAGQGMQDGLDVLNALAAHPATAAFISKKLCKRFLGEDVAPEIIDTVAAAYMASGGDIKEMLRAGLTPANVYDARPRYKRPFHVFASALRALPSTLGSTTALQSLLWSAGHKPYYWGSPDGYPDTFEYWQGGLLPRWNFGAQLLSNDTGSGGGIGNVAVDIAAFFAGLSTPDQMIDKIDLSLFAGEMPDADWHRLRDYLAVAPASVPRRRDTIGLAIGSPAFQWY